MKSRTSFFNRTVLRKDITRFAPLWGLYAVFSLMAVFLLWNGDPSPARFANNADGILQSMGVINFFYAGLCALLLFGDLFSPRLCNALHAMPLRREGWFLTHCAAGFLFCFIPNTVSALVSALLLRQYCWLAFVWLGLMVLQFLFFFGVGALAAVSAGNRLGGIAIYAIFNFLAVILAWLITTFYEPLLYGVELDLEAYTRFSPVVAFTQSQYVLHNYQSLPEVLVFLGFAAEDWRFAYIAAAVGAVLLLLALLVYRKRQLESAGDLISLQPMAPVFLVIYTLCAGAVLYLISDIMASAFRYGFFVIGLVIGFFTGRMLIERKVNIFSGKNFLGFGVLIAVLGASFLLVWLDPIGTTRYVPEAGQVANVSLSPYPSYSYQETSCQLTEPEDIQAILDLHTDLVENRTGTKDTVLYLHYNLKNGTQVDRKYYVDSQSENGQLLRKYYSRWDTVMQGYDSQTLLQNSCVLEFHSYWETLPSVSIGISETFLEQEMFDEKFGSEGSLIYTVDTLPDGENAKGLDVALVRGLLEAIAADCQAQTMVQVWEYHRDQDVAGYISLRYYGPDSNLSMLCSVELTVFDDCENTVAYLQSLS